MADVFEAAVRIGNEQLERGEGIVYSANRLEVITEQALSNARNGKKVSADVTS